MQSQSVLCYCYIYDIIFVMSIFKIKLYTALGAVNHPPPPPPPPTPPWKVLGAHLLLKFKYGEGLTQQQSTAVNLCYNDFRGYSAKMCDNLSPLYVRYS